MNKPILFQHRDNRETIAMVSPQALQELLGSHELNKLEGGLPVRRNQDGVVLVSLLDFYQRHRGPTS